MQLDIGYSWIDEKLKQKNHVCRDVAVLMCAIINVHTLTVTDRIRSPPSTSVIQSKDVQGVLVFPR